MNEGKKTQDALLEAIDIIIKKRLNNLGFNYYVDGVIQDGVVTDDGVLSRQNDKVLYSVLINGKIYKDIPSMNKMDYLRGDVVRILIKNGNWNKKFIEGMAHHTKFPTAHQFNSIDKSGVEYPLIGDNTTNLWIGASERVSRHHHGKTVVSAGYDTTTNKGYDSMYIAVPNEANTSADVYEAIHNKNLIDYVYPVGSICIRNTRTDPVTTLGGVWTFVDKEFTTLVENDSQDSTYFTPNTEVIKACQLRIIRTGHNITMKVFLTLADGATLTDTQKTLGTFNLEALGISRFPVDRSFPVGYSDGGNAIIMGYLYGDTGKLDVVDIVGADSVSGTSVYFDVTETITSKYMLNDACDKFYWKRKE